MLTDYNYYRFYLSYCNLNIDFTYNSYITFKKCNFFLVYVIFYSYICFELII